LTLLERGVLQLENQSWIATPDELPPVEPYIRQFTSFEGADAYYGNTGNYTAILWQSNLPIYPSNSTLEWLVPDLMHIWLFQEIVMTGGSTAFALQSLITLLSSMAYYDQIGQFDNSNAVQQTFFIAANVPQRFYGFLAVAILLAVHLTVVILIVVMFASETRFSMLGNSWMGLSQAVAADTKEYVSVASTMTDDQLKDYMKTNGRHKSRVGLAPIKGSSQVGIVLLDTMQKSNI
jgi:hypothetical protein